MVAAVINISALLLLFISFFKDNKKSRGALKIALFGALMMIPGLIALPLAGSLIDAGASYTPVAAFITTLTMIGFVTNSG